MHELDFLLLASKPGQGGRNESPRPFGPGRNSDEDFGSLMNRALNESHRERRPSRTEFNPGRDHEAEKPAKHSRAPSRTKTHRDPLREKRSDLDEKTSGPKQEPLPGCAANPAVPMVVPVPSGGTPDTDADGHEDGGRLLTELHAMVDARRVAAHSMASTDTAESKGGTTGQKTSAPAQTGLAAEEGEAAEAIAEAEASDLKGNLKADEKQLTGTAPREVSPDRTAALEEFRAATTDEEAADPAKRSSGGHQDGTRIALSSNELKNAGRMVDPSGISAAQQDEEMNMVEEMVKDTGSAEQFLPEADIPAELAGAHGISRSTAQPSIHDSTQASGAASPIASVNHVDHGTSQPAAVAEGADASLRAVERAQEMIRLHAVRLHSASANSMNVVIKPGHGLELSLELRLQHGAVEARAVLREGDFEYLNRHWPELQRQLDAQGVRLASLLTPDSSAQGGHEQFEQGQSRFEEQSPAEVNAREKSFATSTRTRPSPVRLDRGWETWA